MKIKSPIKKQNAKMLQICFRFSQQIFDLQLLNE